jgi:hypothetical protein
MIDDLMLEAPLEKKDPTPHRNVHRGGIEIDLPRLDWHSLYYLNSCN